MADTKPFPGIDFGTGKPLTGLVVHDGRGGVLHYQLPNGCACRWIRLGDNFTLEGSDDGETFVPIIGAVRVG